MHALMSLDSVLCTTFPELRIATRRAYPGMTCVAGSSYTQVIYAIMKIAIILTACILTLLVPIDAVRAGKSIVTEVFDENESSGPLIARGALSVGPAGQLHQ